MRRRDSEEKRKEMIGRRTIGCIFFIGGKIQGCVWLSCCNFRTLLHTLGLGLRQLTCLGREAMLGPCFWLHSLFN